MGREDYSKVAAEFAAVIRELASNPGSLNNLESYLSCQFGIWLDRRARTPEGLVEELQMFARMKFEDD